MDVKRLVLAGILAWAISTAYGITVQILWLGPEFSRFQDMFRPEDEVAGKMPLVLGAGLFSCLVLALIYAIGYQGGTGFVEGLRFGVLTGLFLVAFASVGVYATLNLDGTTVAKASAALFGRMVVTGVVLGMVYGSPETKE